MRKLWRDIARFFVGSFEALRHDEQVGIEERREAAMKQQRWLEYLKPQ
jgi:hypothetical protein